MDDPPLWLYFVLAGLLACSALCSASETAFFSLDPIERQEQGIMIWPYEKFLERLWAQELLNK